MKNILIYGASGHAKMIIDIIHKKNNYIIKGFIDSYKRKNEMISGYKILGNLEQLSSIIEALNIEGIVIAVGDNFTRQSAYYKIREIAPQLQFVSIIHPNAVIANDVIIEEGTVIMANAVINANAKVGKLTILNTASSLGHDSKMADFSSLASGVTIAGNVQIGFCSAICLGALVIQQITIGDNTVVGAGSLVLKSIGNLKQAFGSPINTVKGRAVDSKYLG
ncbi:NeuD/PglB/VioB family sugar acetyltransferase [Winogradskyella psychrotolerans]|uniref:NeuD/PglB/VioB family sugar acetyltransferase n=1 Tax=Winogradskyella psychrotolerans TaxID=1344585 RepID=UPI001C06FA93|nr:NeuD/PglB/VioB family sugar acetyltransferase [Winogradskyella psychrotolerans]MBU2920263.1 NeuD/PglB/VioB family sugar acetyltransferase [Winogradskyella psychrotolerans]